MDLPTPNFHYSPKQAVNIEKRLIMVTFLELNGGLGVGVIILLAPT